MKVKLVWMKTQVDIVRKQLQMNQTEMKLEWFARKRSNWKRNQVLRRRENGDEYLIRSKKATRYRPGLWGDAVRVKADTRAWGLVMKTERRSSNTSGASPGNLVGWFLNVLVNY